MPGYVIWLIAVFLSVVIGHLILAPTMRGMERWQRLKQRRVFEPLDLWIGSLERATATTLVFYAPKYLAAFIGGWVVLKFALGWQRQGAGRARIPEEVVTRSFLSLGGNVISFAIAIVVGVLAHPDALDAWSGSPSIPF